MNFSQNFLRLAWATLAVAILFLSGAVPGSQARTDGLPEADLAVTKTSTPDPVNAGSNITYTITVNNGGPADAAAVSLNDTLPAGLTFVSFSSPAGWTCSTPGVGGTGAVSCTRPILVPGVDQVFTLIANVPAGATSGTTYSNTASVFAKVFDPNEKNNTSSASNTVAGPTADMAVFKQAVVDEVLPGSNVTYTIQVINGGPSNAASATLNDTLPGTLTFVSLSAPAGWTCSTPAPGGAGLVSCSNASLVPGSVTFTLVANVPAGTPAGT